MNIWKKWIASVLAMMMTLSAWGGAMVYAEEEPSKSIANRFLTYSVNDKTGFFNIKTLEGHPQKAKDNDMDLLYAGDSIETSFTTIRVDGQDYIFGQDYGIFNIDAQPGVTKVDAVNNAVHTEWTIKGIKVTQSAYLSRTDNLTTTGNLSLAYSVENTTDKDHDVAIRVMLDNALGPVDAPVPMVDSELAPIAKESEFFSNGRDPGDFIRFIDNIDNPAKESYVMFDSVYSDRPDKMIVGHWYNLASSKWEYKHDANMAFTSGINDYAKADTATALYWNAETLPAGVGTMNKTFLYGVGNFSVGATEGDFNVALELDDSGLVLNPDGKSYKNNIVEATVTLYNNVDGSEDLLSPVLNLVCDDGATILYDKTDTDLIGFQSISDPLGHLDRGSVRTFHYQIVVEVPETLSTIAVVATVTGNDSDHKSAVKRYIYAPPKKQTESGFAVNSIGHAKFHKNGNRILLLKGTFDETVLQDRTKWAMAFVSKTDPSLRYEVHHDYITISSKEDMTIRYNAEMVLGTYEIEFAFFEEYATLYGNQYVFESFEIVNDSSLMMSQAAYVAVVRRGKGTDSTYEMAEFYHRPEVEEFEKKLPFGDEMIMLLQGEFDAKRDSRGRVVGYVSQSNVILNDVVIADAGSGVERFSSVGVGGVRFTAKNGISCVTQKSLLYDVDSKVECFDGHQYSLLDKTLSIEPKGFVGTLMEVILGAVQLEIGVLGKDAKGYNINFSGTLNLLGYDPTAKESDPAQSKLEEDDEVRKFGRTGRGVTLTCTIDRVLFDKNGFVGIDTSTKISYVATNILGCAQMDKLAMTVNVDTIDNEYGASGTINRKGFIFNLGMDLVVPGGTLPPFPNNFNISFSVPPTKAIGWRPTFGFYLIGAGYKDLISIVEKPGNETAAEYRKRLNQATMDVNGTLGATLFEAILLNGTLSAGSNHLNAIVSGSVLVLPGFAFDLGLYSSWKQAIVAEGTGATISPLQVSIHVKGNTNFIDIYKGGVSCGFTHTDETEGSLVDENLFVFTTYGGLYLPKALPVVGGTEIFGTNGTIDNYGFMAMCTLLGLELGVSYAWGGDVMWMYDAEGEDAYKLLNNAQYVVVKKPEMELMSSGNYISGIIGAEAGYGTLLGIEYHGKTPSVKDLSLTIDGKDHPLTAADSNYQNGNCYVMPDLGEGGRILVGIPDAISGEHTYTLHAPDGVTLAQMQAMNFTKTATAKSVRANGDGTVTVEATKSLAGSRVELYYINDKEAYDNIKTEEYTDEAGEKQVRVYKEVNGEKVALDENFFASFSEHRLAATKVMEQTDSVTFTPEIPAYAKSGTYYLMAVVRSPQGKLSRVLTDTAVHYTNPNQPLSAKGVSLVNIGNGTLRAEVEVESDNNLTGYFVSLYNETDKKYVVESQYYDKEADILFEKPVVEAGKRYHVEVSCVHVFDNTFAESADTAVSAPLTVRQPVETAISMSLMTESKEASHVGTDGATQMLPYLKGDVASVYATTGEAVYGRFVLDNTQTAWSEEMQTEFSYTTEALPGGRHTMYLETKNAMGDITLSEPVTFVVMAGEPALLLDSGTAIVKNGRMTVSGTAHATQTVRLLEQTAQVGADGRFSVTVPFRTERYAERVPITAVGFNGTETEISVVAVNPDITPIDAVVLKANDTAAEEITLKPGESVQITAMGSAAGAEREMPAGTQIFVHEGNNLVTLDNQGVLTALSPGTAYVKALYRFGTVETAEGVRDYTYEDLLKVNIVRQTRTPYSSIPNGAYITPEDALEISGEGTIYYTLDGSEPTEASSKYKEPIYLPEGEIIVKAIAVQDGLLHSDVAEWMYTVEAEEEETESSRPGGGSGSGSGSGKEKSEKEIQSSYRGEAVPYGYQLVLEAEGDGVIHYTTDGTTPDKHSAVYEGPIIVKEDMTVRAVIRYENDVYGKVQTYQLRLTGYDIYLKQDMTKSALMSGYPDGTFRPDNAITRAETATIFRRATEMYGFEIDENRFSDIEMWAKESICDLAAADVINGYPDGTFKPDNPVTRAEFVTMLMRIIGSEGSGANYSDTVGHWAEAYIAKANEYGYINGYEDGTFKPDAPITRAEVMAIMSRVFLFETNGTQTDFSDVMPEHWAFGYIAS